MLGTAVRLVVVARRQLGRTLVRLSQLCDEDEIFMLIVERLALKLERYRNVRLESIYDFEAEARAVAAARAARIPEPKVG